MSYISISSYYLSLILYRSDTFVERNTLMERVYPKLKEYCQERGYEFQVVDMRWGVRDEATDDHKTSDLCMKEIYACQRLSTGPNFVARNVNNFIRICRLNRYKLTATKYTIK